MNNNNGCVAPFIVLMVLLIIIAAAFFGFFNKHVFGNKQIFDLEQKFNVAYISIPGGNDVKIYINKWKDYENSDSIQIISTKGQVYYTHLNRVVLSYE